MDPAPPEDSVFSERACALQARARACGRLAQRGARPLFEVECNGQLLANEARRAWASLEGAEHDDGPGNRALLRLPASSVDAVRELGLDHPDLAILATAYDNAVRAPNEARIMAILNVTPDSFSDGGVFLEPGRAIEHGLEQVEQGAHRIDVGGESTRPGSRAVSAEEELERVLPVIEVLAREAGIPIGIDTTKAEGGSPRAGPGSLHGQRRERRALR